eukprot:TRINITY_DN1472_c0_g1_i1.p1 TRINITY_DN1472_c0_g1~~TRINITY_DN1472_c0_g1_i1.p1  ORF type:complete len:168 (-),score=48.66 TRINITY_DN1472_c0_g1_i1:16-519(-)
MAAIVRTALRASRVQGRSLFPQAVLRTSAPAFQQAAFSLRAFSDVKFAPTHEWFKSDGDSATVGISDFAQGQLGEVVYCELPDVGATFKAKETVCTLESVKAVGEVYAPVDCEVIEVNEKLNDDPALVNSSPLEDGWLIKVKYSGDAAGLMDQAAYDKHVESEAKEE